MSDGPGIMATEGIGEATDAFQAALDAETPSRSRSSREEKKEQKLPIDDLFPNKKMDRSEREGGENEPPPKRDDVESDDEELDDDEEEGDESAPDEDEEDDAEEEPPQKVAGELDLEQVIRTTIDGEEVEVPLGEAIRSGMREKTFHKYCSQLDLAVRETNTQRANLLAHYQNHQKAVEEFDAWMTDLLPTPNWPELFRQDPARGMQMKVEFEALQERRMNVQRNLDGYRAWQQQEANRQLHNFANANRAQLAHDFPEWKDEKVWKRAHESMRRTLRSCGYSDAEIDQLYDARAVRVADKAARFDRMMAAKPKPVKQGFTAAKRNGATPPSRNVSRSLDRAERRPSRVSARDDLQAAYERELEREG